MLLLLILSVAVPFVLVGMRLDAAWRVDDFKRRTRTNDKAVAQLLGEGTIKLLSCAWLRSSGDASLVRCQELPTEAFVEPAAARDLYLSGTRRVGVLSYRWLTAAHPDPNGEHKAVVRTFLNGRHGASLEGLFWDFACLPQIKKDGEELVRRTDEEEAAFRKGKPFLSLGHSYH